MRIAYVIKPLDFVKVSGDEDDLAQWVAETSIGTIDIYERFKDGEKIYELIKRDSSDDDRYYYIGRFTSFSLAIARANGFLEMILEPHLEDVSDLIEWI